MMNDPDGDIETLTKLGLNGVQARAYLTLLRIGPSKAKEVAKASNIARPDIYRTISKLQELSLVEKIITTPARFKAVPIAEAMTMLFRRKERENSKIRKNAANMVARYKENGDPTAASRTENDQFILIPKKEPIVVNTKSLAETTQETICYVIPLKKLLPLMINYSEIFHNAIERKVKIMIITEKPENEEHLMKRINELNKSSNFELRMVTSPITVHFGIFDNQKILLSTSAKSQFSEAPAIFSNNPDIIDLATNYFETEWTTAIETKSKKPITAN
jgi:sugar-specific transcriptional regulator TrmB